MMKTPWDRFLLEKLVVAHLVKKFSACFASSEFDIMSGTNIQGHSETYQKNTGVKRTAARA